MFSSVATDFGSWTTEKNYLFEKTEDSVKIISVCNVIENLAEHGIRCLSCSYTNDVIDVTATTMTSY